jgi:hypothetical protein
MYTQEKPTRLNREGETVIELKDIRGIVTMTAKYQDNLDLITAMAEAMQRVPSFAIINALNELK